VVEQQSVGIDYSAERNRFRPRFWNSLSPAVQGGQDTGFSSFSIFLKRLAGLFLHINTACLRVS